MISLYGVCIVLCDPGLTRDCINGGAGGDLKGEERVIRYSNNLCPDGPDCYF